MTSFEAIQETLDQSATTNARLEERVALARENEMAAGQELDKSQTAVKEAMDHLNLCRRGVDLLMRKVAAAGEARKEEEVRLANFQQHMSKLDKALTEIRNMGMQG